MEIKKNQHMVAQCIQKKFAMDSCILEIDKKIKTYCLTDCDISDYDKKNIKTKTSFFIDKVSIEHSMSRNFVYEFPDDFNINGLNFTNVVENYFSIIEDKYSIKVDELINMLETKKKYEEIKNFIETKLLDDMILFYLRTRQFIYPAIYDGNYKTRTIPEINKDIAKSLKNNPKKKNNYLQRIIINNIFFNSLNEKYRKKLASSIKRNYKLSILESSKEEFLLSDTFLCTASLDFKGVASFNSYTNRDIGLKNIVILIPISAKYYLLYSDPGRYENYKFLKEEEIYKFNSVIYRNSYEQTIGKKRECMDILCGRKVKCIGNFATSKGFLCKKEVWFDEDNDRKYVNSVDNDKIHKYITFPAYDDFIEKPISIFKKYSKEHKISIFIDY